MFILLLLIWSRENLMNLHWYIETSYCLSVFWQNPANWNFSRIVLLHPRHNLFGKEYCLWEQKNFKFLYFWLILLTHLYHQLLLLFLLPDFTLTFCIIEKFFFDLLINLTFAFFVAIMSLAATANCIHRENELLWPDDDSNGDNINDDQMSWLSLWL